MFIICILDSSKLFLKFKYFYDDYSSDSRTVTKNVKNVWQPGEISGFSSVFSPIFSKIWQKIAKCNSPAVKGRESLLYKKSVIGRYNMPYYGKPF